MKFIIVGLGNFGSSLALRLAEGGHEVIGVDFNEARVNKYKEQLTHTLKMDSTNEMAVEQLPLSDTDGVIISIGKDSGAAITTAALFKKYVPECRIVARYNSDIQRTIFEAMGIEEIVNPEAEFALNFSNRLTISGNISSFVLDDQYEIAEFKVPEAFVGKTIEEANILTDWKVSLVTIIRHTVKKNILGKETSRVQVAGVVNGATQIEAGDALVLFGKIKDLKHMMESLS